jgi:hypothetical protein
MEKSRLVRSRPAGEVAAALLRRKSQPSRGEVRPVQEKSAHTEFASSYVPLTDFVVRVLFSDGTVKDIDLAPYIADGPIFEPVRASAEAFRAFRIENGTLAWPNDADIDPDVLYYGGDPPWATPATIEGAPKEVCE